MEAPQTEAPVPQETQEKKKRSPWLIVIIILLILMMCCCVMGAVLCRGGAMLPGFLDRYIRDIPGLENVDEIRDLFDDIINDPDFDPRDFDPEDFFPEDFMEEDPGETDLGPSICSGLSGNLEMQVKVGPADIAGLEPLSIGTIPLYVEPSAGAYLVYGTGTLSFQDQLDEPWGFYIVTFDSSAALSGTCIGDEYSGVLNVTVATEGEQLIQVFVGNDEWDYPWSGEYEFDLELPVEEGAVVSGEGWAFVLHLD